MILLLGFFLGVIITISEPDLQVLAAQVPSVPNMVLILSVAAGVGAFLVVALLRILFGIALAPLLVVFYGGDICDRKGLFRIIFWRLHSIRVV